MLLQHNITCSDSSHFSQCEHIMIFRMKLLDSLLYIKAKIVFITAPCKRCTFNFISAFLVTCFSVLCTTFHAKEYHYSHGFSNAHVNLAMAQKSNRFHPAIYIVQQIFLYTLTYHRTHLCLRDVCKNHFKCALLNFQQSIGTSRCRCKV